MTRHEIYARIVAIDQRIAGAKQWGALLTALDEERRGLISLLSEWKVDGRK
jgi:hypothetical protein